MWLCAVRVMFLVQTALTQPLNGDDSARQPRQLDFRECCPCPDGNSESSFRNPNQWLNNGRHFAELSGDTARLSNGFSRAGGFDDCPCRFRSADSEGSSSILFPTSLLSGLSSKSADLKEDPKNLLEPEVGLASSVLETLREATDEEYRDALARDAARARATEDVIPEESAQNIVTIILPNTGKEDDNTLQAASSHMKEPRCIHPLGSSLSRMRVPVAKPPNVLTEILRMPITKHVSLLHRDMDNGFGASDVLERRVDLNGRNNKLRSNPAILKNKVDNVCEVGFIKEPSLNSVPLLEQKDESPHIFKSSKNPITNMRSNEQCSSNTDMKSSASDMTELFSDKLNPGLKLSSITLENSPLNLKNLLKLRNVELVPPGQLIEKLKLGQHPLKLSPLIESMPKLSDLLKNGIKFDLNKNGMWNNAKNDDNSPEVDTSNTNIQVIPRDRKITTEILDALPSTSNIEEVIDNCDVSQEKSESKIISDGKPIRTEIIDSVPNIIHPQENDDDDNISDNNLGQEARNGDDSKIEFKLDEIISSQNLLDVSVPNAQLDESEQDLGASHCLETVNDERIPSQNTDELLTIDLSKSQNLIEDIPIENEDSKHAVNNKDEPDKTIYKPKESSISKSLTSVRESILKKIEDRKKSLKINKGNVLKEPDIEREFIETCPQDEQLILSEPINNESKKDSQHSNTMQFEDLQKLSDSLLKKSLFKSVPEVDCTNEDDNNLSRKRDKSLNRNEDVPIDSDTESSNSHPTITKKPSNLDVGENNENLNKLNIKSDKQDACVISRNGDHSSKTLRTGPDVNEMTAAASDMIGTQWHDPLQIFKNSRLGLPVFQDIVVQPSSLLDGIRNVPSLNLGGPLNLPTLNDIRERLANIFGRDNKDSTDEDIDCSIENPVMSAEPSTSNFLSRSPLEHLNLDIVQLRPLTGKLSASPKMPGINLKSFRAKVPVPKNLDLKPLRLQSTVGSDGGLLGATLTLGRNPAGIPNIFESLDNPLQNLPNLGETMTRMRTNVERLVNNPLDISRGGGTLPGISNPINSLRMDTVNTIRALQNRMGSSLGQANNLLSNSPKNPIEVIERLADAREDFDAKLKGLHYDLNDRLTTIHENILDQTGISSLNPLYQRGSLGSGNLIKNNNKDIGFKRLHIPVSKKNKLGGKNGVLEKTANYRNKLSSERKASSLSQRNFKMPASASVPVPKTIEAPKLKSALGKSLSNIEDDPKMRLATSRTKPLGLAKKIEDLPKHTLKTPSILGKQVSSFKEKKVKVSFGSTSPSPISPVRSQQRSNSYYDEPSTQDSRPDGGLARRLGFKSRSEPNGSPSEVQPRKTQPPNNFQSRDCDYDMNSLEYRTDLVPFTNKNQGTLTKAKEPNNPKAAKSFDSERSASDGNSLSKSPILPIPSWPTIDDNSFLSKVRDAVKARLASFESKKTSGGSETKISPDMARSASENTEVIVGDSMKENASYKCSMVCTKS